MGSYGGHILPGTFFLVFGFWYAIKYSYGYMRFRSPMKQKLFFCCNQQIPFSLLAIEGIIKIVMTSIGILVELFYPGNPQGKLYGPDGSFVGPMNWQHTTMYFFFALSGLADIISYSAQHVVVPGFDRLVSALALFIEGYLFFFHLHGRSHIDTRVHVLLVLSIWPGALFAFMQVFCMEKRVLLHALELITSASIMIQGSWFWQAAYILYPPGGKSWDPCSMTTHDMIDHHDPLDMNLSQHDVHNTDCNSLAEAETNLMFLTMFWTWHVAAVACIVALIYVIMYQFLKRTGRLDPSFLLDSEPINGSRIRSFPPFSRDRLLTEEDEM